MTPALLQMREGMPDNILSEHSGNEDDDKSVDTQTEDTMLAKQEGEEDPEEGEVIDSDENLDHDHGTPV